MLKESNPNQINVKLIVIYKPKKIYSKKMQRTQKSTMDIFDSNFERSSREQSKVQSQIPKDSKKIVQWTSFQQ